MKRVMVFGKPGGGKSFVAKDLSGRTGLPLYPLDLIQFWPNGDMVPAAEFLGLHQEVIDRDEWVIDGLGTLETFWRRVDAADTLIYVDLPYARHYWWVTKRLLLGFFRKPEGWPEGSSVLKGSIASWRNLRLSPKFWNEDFLSRLVERAESKRVIHVTSVQGLKGLSATLA